jgi:heat shock protein HslJ
VFKIIKPKINMYSVIKILTALSICFLVIACSSDDKEKQTQPNTNTAENPLIVPNTTPSNATPTPTGPQTIYATWVVDSVNNKLIDSNHYSNLGTPYFNFDSGKKTMSGHTGCGGINAKLKVQGDRLIFDNVVAQSQDCKTKDFEKKLVSGFKSGKTTYKIVNGYLHLNLGGGTNLVLRKIS